MRITRLKISNFRSIKHLDVDLGETTVFVGPNNAGKTAILDAIRIAMTRRWGQRGTGFTEYDVHLASDADDPKTSSGISIELHADESEDAPWPDAIAQALGDVVQLDPVTGRRSVALRTQCAWSEEDKAFMPSWEFLSAEREPLVGSSARRVNLESFWQHLPVFYLGALRNVDDEFSPRSSQFWRRLLSALEVPAELESWAMSVLDEINSRLLEADPRLQTIAETLSGATQVSARDRDGELDLRMVPLKMWDLVSRAEIILRNEAQAPWLPLQRQGQGIQSLSVIFLFQAFVGHVLSEFYEPDSTPILALEEPETHLHPQAARTLWQRIQALPGQKIVTTHSPYFVQRVPFRDLRLVRLTDTGTEVRSLPASFSSPIPPLNGLPQVVEQSHGALQYDQASKTLTVTAALDEGPYRSLLMCCGSHAQREEIVRNLRDLRDRSSLYITDSDLDALETWARRMRGEIFFAERWLIVEGQGDYLILHALAQAMDYDLDEHGVSVIDAQNSGNPAAFAALARALGIPWLAVFDGDDAGRKFIGNIRRRGFNDDEINKRCRLHEAGDVEDQLVADGLAPELRGILADLGVPSSDMKSDDGLLKALREHKVAYAAGIAARLRDDADVAQRATPAFRAAIKRLRGLA